MAGGLSKASQIGELDGKSTMTPYLVTSRFERHRALAATLSDTLCVLHVYPPWRTSACTLVLPRYCV